MLMANRCSADLGLISNGFTSLSGNMPSGFLVPRADEPGALMIMFVFAGISHSSFKYLFV